MDTTIQAASDACCVALRAAGYMESTIANYRKGFRMLALFCEDGMINDEGIDAYMAACGPAGGPYEQNYQYFRIRIARLAQQFRDCGSFDLGVCSNRKQPPQPRSQCLGATLRKYLVDCAERGLAKGTCDYYGRLAREYLLYLETLGIDEIDRADARSVLGFMADISSRWANSSTYHLASNFRPFLRWLGREDLMRALSLTRPLRKHNIAPSICDADADKVARACVSGAVPVRDAAITLLALTSGMRACDIVGLKLDDINWAGKSLSIVQQKTGNAATIPLSPAVIECLGRYILTERPDSDFYNVFIRKIAPYTPFSDHSAIYDVTRRVLASAGVHGGGSLLFRHSVATKMMRSGIQLPVISAVLGHADPNSAKSYLFADEASMAACVLPLPKGATYE